jgi:riboflavin kinase/FMN adenylyltransferase
LLGEPYRLRGRVGRGAERGRKLGFPTANLDQVRVVLPRDGVYAGRVVIVERDTSPEGHAAAARRALARHRGGPRPHAAAIHVGPNPTFAEQTRKVEVHLIDFDGDLYGRLLDVDFLGRLRDTATFAGPDALKAQLHHDVAEARRIAAG